MAQSNHFWVSSDCKVLDPIPQYPSQVNSASDIITISRDIGNKIPDKSWMLYLFEFFIDRQRKEPIPIELNLSCAFNNDGKFDAIFGGHNQYQFTQVFPVVGHSYIREIIVNDITRKVNYNLTDLNTGVQEQFELDQGNIKDIGVIREYFKFRDIKEIKFEGSGHFTGVEWWNLMQENPYPIRYQITVSLLQYGMLNSSDSKRVTYYSYNSLTPDKDPNSKQYPISFQNSRVMRGCICYDITDGNSNTRLTYRF
jgi:hypothetical protein